MFTIWYWYYSCFASGSFNNNVTLVQKDLFWSVFGHFLQFGQSDQLHIAYFDVPKQCSWFGNGIKQFLRLDHSLITLRWHKMTCFHQFWAIFLSLDHRINFILHTNVFHHSATLPDHEGSFKCHKNAFLNDPKIQKRGFWPFSGLWSVGSSCNCKMW